MRSYTRILYIIAVSFYFNPVFAQLFSSNKKVDEKLKAMQEQIDQINSFNQSNAQSLNEIKTINEKFKQHKADTSVVIEDLRNEIQILKGEIAFFKRQMEIFESNQKDFFKDAQFRLNEMESTAAEKPAVQANTKKSTPAKTSKSSAKEAYNKALAYYRDDKNYTQAVQEFESFTKNYPKHTLSANAYYWMGESYFALGKYARAIKTFDIVTKQYGNSVKKCASIFMQGRGFEGLKKESEAKLFYSEVVSQCPDTDVAKKAKAKLQ